jgi:hypothetical protein
VNDALIKSTALRGLALAIMDDAEDAKEDKEQGELTIFTEYPLFAADTCMSILANMQEYKEDRHPLFEFMESTTLHCRLLDVFCCAALIRCLQFKYNCIKGEGIFNVRHYLVALSS